MSNDPMEANDPMNSLGARKSVFVVYRQFSIRHPVGAMYFCTEGLAIGAIRRLTGIVTGADGLLMLFGDGARA